MEQFGKSQTIVIVEDTASLAEIYKTRLERLGYACTVASDGIEALYFIEKMKPDLVLLDLMVPNIAGDQILARMRANPWGKDIPVFIISNLNEADAPAGLRELGIEGYAVKANLSNDQLEQLVDSILQPPDQAEPLSLDANEVTSSEQTNQPDVYNATPTSAATPQTNESLQPNTDVQQPENLQPPTQTT